MKSSQLAHTPVPVPVPPSEVVLHLPKDQYLHIGAPTEWWWHTGTLKAGGRVFGFEINTAAFYPLGFFQVMLTDVENQKHYQLTSLIPGIKDWAESDPSKDWWVKQTGLDGVSYVTMKAPQADPTKNMQIEAVMVDTDTKTVVKFSLKMSQEGRPLFVWGHGVLDYPEKPGGLKQNNYYYSLTRIHTEGTLTVGDDVFAVEGLTWMDHEYGNFGDAAHPALWFLQTMQLENGVHISHYTTFSKGAPAPKLDVPVPSKATIEFPDGTTYFQTDCTMTPTGKTWTGPTGVVFFMEFKVEIPSFDAVLHVVSLVDAQDFPFPTLPGSKPSDTYEGVAKASGTFKGKPVQGTAWNEQQS